MSTESLASTVSMSALPSLPTEQAFILVKRVWSKWAVTTTLTVIKMLKNTQNYLPT